MEEFNLHLTGDIHAIAAANNLLGILYKRLRLTVSRRDRHQNVPRSDAKG